MNDTLKKSFDKYLAVASEKFTHRGKLKRPKGAFTLILSEAEELRSIVKAAENHHSFKSLIQNAAERFDDRYVEVSTYVQLTLTGLDGMSTKDWEYAIQNFFRRSGLYHDLYGGRSIQAEHYFEAFVSAFETEEFDTTFLAPIDNTSFTKQCMDFGEFSISKFEVSDLKRLLNTHITSVFYPHRMIDPELLRHSWFIRIRRRSSIREVMCDFGCYPGDPPVCLQYPVQQVNLYPAVSAMSLYNWNLHKTTAADALTLMEFVTNSEASSIRAASLGDIEKCFRRFTIPCLLEARNDLIGFPPLGSHVSKESLVGLNLQHVCPSESQIISSYYFDEGLTHDFETFVCKTRETIIALGEGGSQWDFIERALHYYLKAYFTDGLDALLWFIVALESLLGSRKDVTKTLAQRVAFVLADTKQRRKRLAEKIRDIYDMRSRLIHGDHVENVEYHRHLSLAGQASRLAILWFLRVLDHYRGKSEKGNAEEPYPNREDILQLIDLHKPQMRKHH